MHGSTEHELLAQSVQGKAVHLTMHVHLYMNHSPLLNYILR